MKINALELENVKRIKAVRLGAEPQWAYQYRW